MCSPQYKVAAGAHTHIQAAHTGWELLWEPSRAGGGGGGERRGEGKRGEERRGASRGGSGRERESTGSGELDGFRHHRSFLKKQFLEGSFPVHAVD